MTQLNAAVTPLIVNVASCYFSSLNSLVLSFYLHIPSVVTLSRFSSWRPWHSPVIMHIYCIYQFYVIQEYYSICWLWGSKFNIYLILLFQNYFMFLYQGLHLILAGNFWSPLPLQPWSTFHFSHLWIHYYVCGCWLCCICFL